MIFLSAPFPDNCLFRSHPFALPFRISSFTGDTLSYTHPKRLPLLMTSIILALPNSFFYKCHPSIYPSRSTSFEEWSILFSLQFLFFRRLLLQFPRKVPAAAIRKCTPLSLALSMPIALQSDSFPCLSKKTFTGLFPIFQPFRSQVPKTSKKKVVNKFGVYCKREYFCTRF